MLSRFFLLLWILIRLMCTPGLGRRGLFGARLVYTLIQKFHPMMTYIVPISSFASASSVTWKYLKMTYKFSCGHRDLKCVFCACGWDRCLCLEFLTGWGWYREVWVLKKKKCQSDLNKSLGSGVPSCSKEKGATAEKVQYWTVEWKSWNLSKLTREFRKTYRDLPFSFFFFFWNCCLQDEDCRVIFTEGS